MRSKSRRVIGSSFQGVKVRVEDARPDTSFLEALPATRLRGRGSRGSLLRRTVMVTERRLKTARRKVWLMVLS